MFEALFECQGVTCLEIRTCLSSFRKIQVKEDREANWVQILRAVNDGQVFVRPHDPVSEKGGDVDRRLITLTE